MKSIPNPSYVMGDIVRSWDKIINPALQRGETLGLAGVILGFVERGRLALQDAHILQWKNGSAGEFDCVMQGLDCIATSLRQYPLSQEVVESFRLTASRYISQMDMIMRGDEEYESAKAGK